MFIEHILKMNTKERNLLYQATDKLQELTGATKRDLSIRARDNYAERDGTIALTFGETTEFTAHEAEAIKLYYQNAIEIDLLPFGDIEK